MIMKRWLKTVLAGTLAFAMVMTSVPVNVSAVDTEFTDDLVLHWDMTTDADGNLNDLTGNGNVGELGSGVELSEIDEVPVLNMTSGAVAIPDGTITKNATELTVNMLVKISQNVKSSWMWCIGSSNKSYVYVTGCFSQYGKMRGGLCYVPGSNGNGWSFESVIDGDSALTEGEWQNMTVTFVEGGDYTFYLNGVKQKTIDVTTGNAGEEGHKGECTL